MNKMKVALMVASFAGLASAAAVWDGADGSGAVQSGGYWFSYDDSKESLDGGPGASTSNFPAGSTASDVVGPWATTNGGMFDVTFTINPTTYKYPFAGIGFNWSDPEAVSAQTWSNICIEYSLSGTVPVQMEIKNDPSLDANNANFQKMPAQATMAITCFPVAKFAQESGWGTKLPVASAMTNSLGMKFKAQLKTPPAAAATANLKIKSITTDGTPGVAIKSVLGSSVQGLKLAQMGRTISISGLGKTFATVEVISMQGKVMAREVLSAGKVMNLSNISSGIYLVRAQSEKINLSRRITLR